MDLVFRARRVVTPQGEIACDVGVVDGRVVAVEQGVLLGTAFHPEVGGELRFHRRFLAHVARVSGA